MKYSESQALSKVASYCSKAERSELDVKLKLQRWELDNTIIQNIILHLKKENFLNEERFCRAFIKDKLRFNRWGRTKIIFELKKKQIPHYIIDSCFSEFDSDQFEEQLFSILRNKAKSVKANNEYEKRNKLIRFALGRGFSIEQTQRVLETILND